MGRALPATYWRWQLARATGWSLEYVDGLSLARWAEYLQIVDGENRAAKAAAAAVTKPPKRRGRR